MIYQWLQRHARIKAVARQVVSGLLRVLPASMAYRLRARIEKLVYSGNPHIGELPPIFHYWSNTYLRPALNAQGCDSPDDFFFQALLRLARRTSDEHRSLTCMSIAAGRCELEIGLAQRLRDEGFSDVHFLAVDLNSSLLEDAREGARKAGVSSSFGFRTGDLNTLTAGQTFDAVLAHQCLHHMVDLESVMEFVAGSMGHDGVFLLSDVIGRNGHMLWPEGLEHVDSIWGQLASRYRYDHARGHEAQEYVNYNHANVGFEGIRAEDILGLLRERFSFRQFIAFGCIILPFVERRFGWNFDPDNVDDRKLIDRIAVLDMSLLQEGILKPTQLLAELCRRTDQGETPADRDARLAWRDPKMVFDAEHGRGRFTGRVG